MNLKKMSHLKFFIVILVLLVFRCGRASDEPCATSNSLRIYGSNPNQGMLQICTSGYWHGVNSYYWDCTNAKAACRQLGFTGLIAYNPYCCNHFGSWNLLDNRYWQCSDSDVENGLTSCPSWHQNNNYNYGTAGLFCYSLVEDNENSSSAQVIPICTHGNVRLIGGTTLTEGRVEICYEGSWSSLCWIYLTTATVICKQINNGYTHAATLPSDYGSSQSFVDLDCSSLDFNHLNECTINEPSFCYERTSLPTCSYAIRCYSSNISEICSEGSIRLIDGDIVQEGYLEMCLDGVWGRICSYGWDTTDSYVACKEMGYPGTDIAPALLYSQSEDYSVPILYSYFYCQGFEKTLFQCSKTSYPHFSCSYGSTVQIRCYDDCSNGDIRVVGGPTESEGTVEICRNYLWGLVTDLNWGDSEARVVCRQLGFQTQNVHAVLDSYYGRPEKTVHYSHVDCNGAEDKLTQCGKTTLSLTAGKTILEAADVAGVSCHGPPTTTPPCIVPPPLPPSPNCTNGEIQLVGGQTVAEGRLEYCYNGQWSSFCTLLPMEATLACKELGYTQYTWAAVFTDGRFGSNNMYSLFQRISCNNSMLVTALDQCTLYEATDCLPSCLPIGIRCYEPDSCEEGAVRMVDGIIQQEGRVEICKNGVWGSVCDQSWDKTDAHIVCQEMGYPELEPVAYHNSYFGDGYGPIIYTNVSCGGWEQRLADCSKTSYPSFACPRGQTAGVLCGYQCNDGDVRLAGGLSDFEGTVEICFGNIWGLIAENGWGVHDAQVVCRQLGFISEGAVSYVNSHFGKPNKTIQASGVTCFGDEQTLTECTMTTYELEVGKNMIDSVNVVGVSCVMIDHDPCMKAPSIGPVCTNDSVRLTGGNSSNEGRLEYCYQETWSPVCSVSMAEATVACRQLGYAEFAWAAVLIDGNFNTTNSSFFVNLTCTGTEVDLIKCSRQSSCSSNCSSETVIRCYDASTHCIEGSVRLAGGTPDKNGRVEVCYNGVWGTVCGDGWGIPDTFVVCKQLGLTDGVLSAVTNSSVFGSSYLPVVYSDVACNGWESNILQCTRNQHGSFLCSSRNFAGVICSDACSNGDIRLYGGAVTTEGTVEVCYESVWGLIMAKGWMDRDAAVICKKLGHPSGGAVAVVDSRFGKPTSIVHLSNVQCSGTENTVFNCSADKIHGSNTVVGDVNVAGVFCRDAPPAPSSEAVPTSSATVSIVTVMSVEGVEVNVPLASFVGVFGVIIIAGGIIITLLAAALYKTKKKVRYIKSARDNLESTVPLKDNPVYGVEAEDVNY